MDTAQPRLVIPQLRSFYAWAEPLSWALIRITAGLMIIPHGWPKRLVMLAIALRGGGPYSLDRAIGKEL